jgi:hypothetical protein
MNEDLTGYWKSTDYADNIIYWECHGLTDDDNIDWWDMSRVDGEFIESFDTYFITHNFTKVCEGEYLMGLVK